MSHGDDDDNNNNELFVDRTLTRVLTRQFEIDGTTFSWWAVSDKPAFVSVSSPFGNKAALTDRDPETFARRLARQLLDERAGRLRSVQK